MATRFSISKQPLSSDKMHQMKDILHQYYILKRYKSPLVKSAPGPVFTKILILRITLILRKTLILRIFLKIVVFLRKILRISIFLFTKILILRITLILRIFLRMAFILRIFLRIRSCYMHKTLILHIQIEKVTSGSVFTMNLRIFL